MNNFWKNIPFRKKMLNEFGKNTGICYMFYCFKENKFYFSDNIDRIIGETGKTVYSLKQWYNTVYKTDRRRLRQGSRNIFQTPLEHYGFNYRIQNNYGQLVWVNNKGKCTFDQQGRPDYFLGTLTVWNEHMKKHKHTRQNTFLQTLHNVHSDGQDGYLLLIGINDMRKINLKYGREFGNAVLQDLMNILQIENPRFSQPFRVGGSTFCTIATEVCEKDIETFFFSVQSHMQTQCIISGGCVSLQKYQVPESDMLLHYAESALRTAKSKRNIPLVFFNPEDYEQTLTAIELQTDLETSVKNNFDGFSLEYQPKVRSETFELVGAEALLRFTSPRRGKISPSEFVPILERNGLIVPVGLWVIRTALGQCRLWHKEIPDLKVSINMSYVQLQQPDIQTEVLSILHDTGLTGDALIIEVTESIELQGYPYLNTIFSAWKKEGIKISIDDFGTGYSSLSWIKQLCIDEIKIDRCFVNGIQHSAYNLRLLSNIIELASNGYLQVCCEGVETSEELSVLETLHPTLYQGFYFSGPVTSEKFSPHKIQETVLNRCRQQKIGHIEKQPSSIAQINLEHALLETTEDAISICDIETHEIYYMNPSAQRIFGAQNYAGRKCFQLLRGKDAPCEFCPNATLRHDTFSIQEDLNTFCDRRFILKNKLLDAGGRTLRFQVAMDITKQEYMGQQTRERLEFANRITEYVDTLSCQKDWYHAVELALSAMGKFYKADRAYLFERSPEHTEYWNNTFEWCAPNVTPQKDNLQQIAPDYVERWLKVFEEQGAVILYNLDPLRKKSPLEWEILRTQGIQRLIAVPLMSGGQIAGFIGVDNPRYAIQDDSQARVLASFLAARFRRERKEWQLNKI